MNTNMGSSDHDCANYNFLQLHDSKPTKTLDYITQQGNYTSKNRHKRYAAPLCDEGWSVKKRIIATTNPINMETNLQSLATD